MGRVCRFAGKVWGATVRDLQALRRTDGLNLRVTMAVIGTLSATIRRQRIRVRSIAYGAAAAMLIASALAGYLDQPALPVAIAPGGLLFAVPGGRFERITFWAAAGFDALAVLALAAPLAIEGHLSGVSFIGDTTERVRAHRNLERAARETDRFVATVSHEVRTPLTAVMGLSSVIAVAVAADGDLAILEVSDDGSEIPEHVRDETFEPFVRADPAGHVESVGLGLNVSRELAQLMGGTLRYEHTGGRSRFHLSLPAAQ